MKINVAMELNKSKGAVGSILSHRGLTEEWLSAGEKDLLDGRDMRNFEKAEQLLKENLEKKIAIYVDSDTDGFSSSAIMFAWLADKYGVVPEVIIPAGKVHGIILDLIPEDIDLLIVPDASSSEGEIHKILIERGTQVLVLDHHEIDLEGGEHAVIVNPHHPECTYKNKDLSGTGVVYKFIEGVDKNDKVDFYSKHLDLAAIATVADSMSLKSMDNKAIANLGLREINNPYFKEYYNFNTRLASKPFDATLVSFYLVPPINALIRIGEVEDKRDLFFAMAGEAQAQPVVAMIGRIKSKQDRDKTPVITRIALNLAKEDGLKHSAIMTKVPPTAAKAVTGVMAGQLTNIYKRPIFLFREDGEGNLTGSARNPNNSPVSNLKDFCNESGLFNWAAGHQAAFGWSLPKENKEKFLEYCDNNLPPYEPVFYVDFEIGKDDNKAEIVKEISELSPHYGPGFSEVLIKEQLFVKPSDISVIGKNKNVLKFFSGGITYIAFGFNDPLPMSPGIWTIVGKPSMNEFNEMLNPQITIESWEVSEVEL